MCAFPLLTEGHYTASCQVDLVHSCGAYLTGAHNGVPEVSAIILLLNDHLNWIWGLCFKTFSVCISLATYCGV